MLQTQAACGFSLVQLAALLNAGYQHYAVPVAFDAPALARRILIEHIDLAASHVLKAGGVACGIMLVARRGSAARLAALGIAPNYRKQGLGQQAVRLAQAEAIARGDHQLRLEVITSNVAAQRSYAACDFVVTRQLLGYEQAQLAAAAFDPARYELCGAEQIMPLLSAALPSDLPWQLAPQSLAGLVTPAQALRRRDGRAAALFDPSGAAPRLLGFGVLPGAQGQGLGTHLLASLLQAFPGHWRISAMVPDNLIDGFLLARGWQRSPLAQYEMLWRA